MFIRLDGSITSSAIASHGRGHLTPSPLILGDWVVAFSSSVQSQSKAALSTWYVHVFCVRSEKASS